MEKDIDRESGVRKYLMKEESGERNQLMKIETDIERERGGTVVLKLQKVVNEKRADKGSETRERKLEKKRESEGRSKETLTWQRKKVERK